MRLEPGTDPAAAPLPGEHPVERLGREVGALTAQRDELRAQLASATEELAMVTSSRDRYKTERDAARLDNSKLAEQLREQHVLVTSLQKMLTDSQNRALDLTTWISTTEPLPAAPPPEGSGGGPTAVSSVTMLPPRQDLQLTPVLPLSHPAPACGQDGSAPRGTAAAGTEEISTTPGGILLPPWIRRAS